MAPSPNGPVFVLPAFGGAQGWIRCKGSTLDLLILGQSWEAQHSRWLHKWLNRRLPHRAPQRAPQRAVLQGILN